MFAVFLLQMYFLVFSFHKISGDKKLMVPKRLLQAVSYSLKAPRLWDHGIFHNWNLPKNHGKPLGNNGRHAMFSLCILCCTKGSLGSFLFDLFMVCDILPRDLEMFF